MTGEQEIAAQCPYCFSAISFLCESFSGNQSYIEDCEVCCKPIQVTFEVDETGEVLQFQVQRLDE